MPRNSSGDYTLPSPMAVALQVASSATVNNIMNDVATELTDSLDRSGKGSMLADLPMANHKVTGMKAGTAAADAATVAQVRDGTLPHATAVTGTVDALVVTFAPAHTSLPANARLRWTSIGLNTVTAPTATIDALAAPYTITGPTGSALNLGDTGAAGYVCDLIYDGTRLRLMNPASVLGLGKTGVSVYQYASLATLTNWAPAFNAALAANSVVTAPEGLYPCTGPILLNDQNQIIGAGAGQASDTTTISGTKFVFSGTGTACFINNNVANALNYCTLRDFGVYHTGTYTNIIDMRGPLGCRIQDLNIESTSTVSNGISTARIGANASWANWINGNRIRLPDSTQTPFVTSSGRPITTDMSDSDVSDNSFTGGAGSLFYGPGGMKIVGNRFDRAYTVTTGTDLACVTIQSNFSSATMFLLAANQIEEGSIGILMDADVREPAISNRCLASFTGNGFRMNKTTDCATGAAVVAYDIALVNATGTVIALGPNIVGNTFTSTASLPLRYDYTKWSGVYYVSNIQSNTSASAFGRSSPQVSSLIQTSVRNLTSTTSAQAIFDASPTGAFNAGVSLYRFRVSVRITGLSGTSGDVSFALGGTAVAGYCYYECVGKKNTTGPAAASLTAGVSTASTPIVAANILGAIEFVVDGYINVTTAGTLIPQVALGVAAAAVVQNGSSAEFWPVAAPVCGDFS